jgi:hypothetical protein
MNTSTLLETTLLLINAFQAYKACAKGLRCGVAAIIFLLNAMVYVAGRIRVNESVMSLVVPVAVLVVLLVVAE